MNHVKQNNRQVKCFNKLFLLMILTCLIPGILSCDHRDKPLPAGTVMEIGGSSVSSPVVARETVTVASERFDAPSPAEYLIGPGDILLVYDFHIILKTIRTMLFWKGAR